MAGADSDLEFDTSVLKDRGETYSSLTDMNEIEVFTRSFEKRIETVREQENSYEVYLAEQPFTGVMAVDESGEQILEVLFQDRQQSMIRGGEVEGQSRNGIIFSVVGVLFALFLGIMLLYCRKRNRKIEKEKQHIADLLGMKGD